MHLILHSTQQNIIFQHHYQSYCDYLLKMGRMDKEQAVFEQITLTMILTGNSEKISISWVWCFSSLLLVFELIQQASLVNFMLYLNIFRIWKILFWRKYCTYISCLVSFHNSTAQTATISKAMIKFWPEFHVLKSSDTTLQLYNFLILTLPRPSLSQQNRKALPPAPLDTSTTALVCIFSWILNSVMEGWK